LKLVLVVLLAALTSTSVFGSRVVVSLSALHLGASPAVVGMIMSLYFIPPVVFSMSMGRLVDRAGVALPMALVAVLLITGHALPAAWPSLWTLAASAACTGTAFVGAMIALSSATAFAGGEEDRTTNFSWFTLGTGFGVGLGPFISGFTMDAAGDRVASIALGLWPACILALLAFWSRRLPVVTSARPANPASANAAAGKVRLPWLGLLRDRRLRAALAIGVMAPAGYEVFLFVIPVLGARNGISSSTIGSILAAGAVAIFAIRLALPLLVKWMREWMIMRVVFAVMAVSYLLMSHFTQPAILFSISVAMGIAQGLSQPVIMSMYFTASPAGRQGEAAGIRGILQNALSALSPVMMGGLGTLLGLGPVLIAAAVIFAGASEFARRMSSRW
jgi:MFS family permease